MWTDVPANSVQNKLAMVMQHNSSRRRWISNSDRPGLATAYDRVNNVHIIRVDDSPEGDYFLQVFARNLLVPPQDFALVVFGALATDRLTAFS